MHFQEEHLSTIGGTNLANSRMANNANRASNSLTSSINRLSSGSRLENSSTDAAAYSISTRLQSDQVGLKKAMENTNQGISLLQTAEGSLNEITSMLTRMRELSVQSSTSTYNDNDRSMLNTEYEYLFSEIDRITDNSRYNSTIDILASTDSDFVLQVGILGNADNRISLDLTRLNSDTTSIGLNTALSIETKDNGLAALTVIDTALESISDKRNYAGSFITRLESTLGEATNSDENMSGSVSRIDDVDYAMESARSAQSQILTQASVAALAQAKNMNLSHFQSIFANL